MQFEMHLISQNALTEHEMTLNILLTIISRSSPSGPKSKDDI